MTDMFDTMFNEAFSHEKVANARVVATIARNGHSYSFGFNQKKSHPFQKRFGKHEDAIYLHAEIDAIKNHLKWDYEISNLSLYDMYVLRIKQDGRNGPVIPALAKPCIGCMRAIAHFGIKNVYYSTDNSREWECL